jgi:hypothetical protein
MRTLLVLFSALFFFPHLILAGPRFAGRISQRVIFAG